MSQVWDESWCTEPGGPLFEDFPTLQQEVAAGDAWEREQTPWTVRVGVRSCPGLLYAALRGLRGKDPKLSTIAATTRYASRTGIKIVEKLLPLKVLEERWKTAYLAADELALMKFQHAHYDFGSRLGASRVYLNIFLYLWVDARISDLLPILGLDHATLALITLIFGLVQDECQWLPEVYFDIFAREVEEFGRWLLSRESELLAK